MDSAVTRLKQLGFSDYEARAYTALLKENPSTAYEISKNSGIPSSKVYEVVKRLESRRMIQSIHGERSTMFIPAPPDEFIENYRRVTDESLSAARSELKKFKTGIDASYTWHIKDYEGLILKAKRMLDTCRHSVLLSIWPAELEELAQSINSAEGRGVRIALVHHGTTNTKFGQLYRHPVEDTIYARKGARGFALVADSKEVLTGKIEGRVPEAIWSMNEGFVMMAEDYIRHDIYVMKIVQRFDPLLKETFGARYEKLRDVHTNEENPH
ncbi:MAG TPA: TrmB family transcriptional regulator [Nitrospirae bacterium]|nr:sugar-specific transcriptional regulator TrmB [bacterium BMS3Abin10]HDH51018.1 TrmB family transcriptional regulator [Nitrospirota bacterium]HDK82390.1 TrmB family transcriptional regulator [Nitrospirota bacterium]HDO25794.1 TrmB family transcriptional regulator [Nitrospirota bacterium]